VGLVAHVFDGPGADQAMLRGAAALVGGRRYATGEPVEVGPVRPAGGAAGCRGLRGLDHSGATVAEGPVPHHSNPGRVAPGVRIPLALTGQDPAIALGVVVSAAYVPARRVQDVLNLLGRQQNGVGEDDLRGVRLGAGRLGNGLHLAVERGSGAGGVCDGDAGRHQCDSYPDCSRDRVRSLASESGSADDRHPRPPHGSGRGRQCRQSGRNLGILQCTDLGEGGCADRPHPLRGALPGAPLPALPAAPLRTLRDAPTGALRRALPRGSSSGVLPTERFGGTRFRRTPRGEPFVRGHPHPVPDRPGPVRRLSPHALPQSDPIRRAQIEVVPTGVPGRVSPA
jgi:hypothetical protein